MFMTLDAFYHAGSGKYCTHLKEHTRPSFEYYNNQSKPGFPYCQCTITYWKDGSYKRMKSGSCPSIESAEEKAAKKILSQENWL